MSRFSGPQGPGARREAKKQRVLEAEERRQLARFRKPEKRKVPKQKKKKRAPQFNLEDYMKTVKKEEEQ